MQVPPRPSKTLKTNNIFDICVKLQQEVRELDPGRPITKRCYEIGTAINNALNKPVFDAGGKVNLRAVKALADAESKYMKFVVTDGHPRCFAFEQVFREIRAIIPTMPDPQAPTISRAPAMSRMGEYHREKILHIRSCIAMCKERVEKGPSPPEMTTDMEELMKDKTVKACWEFLRTAYGKIGAKDKALWALRLLAPHFSDPPFAACILSIYLTEIHLCGREIFGALDLLLEAHELTLPAPISPALQIAALDPKAGTRLCDLLPSKYTVLPLREVRVYCPGGIRLDYDVETTSRYFQHIIKGMTDRISWDETTYQEEHNQRLYMIQSLKAAKSCEHVEEMVAILGEHTVLEKEQELTFQLHLLELVDWMAVFYYGEGSE